MTACGGGSKSSNNNDQGQQQGPPQKPTLTFDANPKIISGDESSSHLSWSSTNATSVTITPNLNAQPPSGALDVLPEDTTTYTATATGPGGTSDPKSITVTVAKELNLLFQANPPVIIPGVPATLNWTTKGALSLSIDNGIGNQSSGAFESVTV